MLNFSKLKILIISLFSLFALLFAMPSLFPKEKLPALIAKLPRPSLGLDLRGGSQLMFEIDFNYYKKEQLNNLKDELRTVFREKTVRAVPTLSGDKILFSLSDAAQREAAKDIVQKLSKRVGIDTHGDQVTVYFTNQELLLMEQNLVKQSIEILRRRIDETGTKEPIIQTQGDLRILLQLPGVDNPDDLKAILGKTAKMTFHFVRGMGERMPSSFDLQTEKLYDDAGNIYLIDKEVVLSGDLLVDANPTYFEGKPAVAFRFNELGARKFAQITQDNLGKVFAIVLDNKIVTAPRINAVISQGMGVISGNFTTKEANQVALLLRAGALPAPLKIIEERAVGPSLGSDSIKYGMKASIGALVLVATLMLIFYGSFGMIANIAMIINVAILIVALSLIGATLTLPGIAGIALTMGMSVDANVLIFERIKEELREKRSVLSAIEHGFHQAYRTIVDSNLTTLIVAAFLYIFGSGPVKGFAVTLSFGIISSMFSAILLARMLIVLWIRARNLSKSDPAKLGLI